jgi:hypothetical protein
MSDFSVYTAEQVRDWMSQGTVATPPGNIYVTVFDDTDTEQSSNFAGARATTAAGTDWATNGTQFENASQITLGEATTDVTNIQDVALYDSATGGNLLARYTLTDAPFDVSDGTVLLWDAGNLSFDIVDRTE